MRQNIGGFKMIYGAVIVLVLCMAYLIYAIIDPERF